MKTLEGIWTLEVFGAYGWECMGVLVLEDGKLLGGGNNHYARGGYSTSGRSVSMEAQLEYFGTLRPMFGAKQKSLTVNIEGKRSKDTIEGSVSLSGSHRFDLQARLVKRCGL